MKQKFSHLISTLLLTSCGLYATTANWQGTVSNSMGATSNWSPAVVPVPGASIVFPPGVLNLTPFNDVLGGLAPGALTIGDAYTISGNLFSLNSSISLNYANPATSSTINNIINLGSNTLTVTSVGSSTQTLNGSIQGAGFVSFSNTNGGTLVLGGNNNFTQTLTVINGTLKATNAGALGTPGKVILGMGGGPSATATLDVSTVSPTISQLSGNLGSTINLGNQTFTISNGFYSSPYYGAFVGSGTLVVSGGVLPLMGGSPLFTGTLNIEGGVTLETIDLGGISSVNFSSAGGNLIFGSSTTSSAQITLYDAATIGANTFDVTLTQGIQGNNNPLNKIGPGKLTLSATNNTGISPLYIEGGIVNIGPSSLPTSTDIVFNKYSGTLQARSDLTINENIVLSDQGTIDTNGHTVTVLKPISGGYSLVKAGPGTLIPTSVGNNYAGMTIIKGGTLTVQNPLYLPPTTQVVFSGDEGERTLQLGFNGALSPPAVVFISSGAIDVPTSYDATVSTLIAGGPTSTFTKSGAGTLGLEGSNIYKGPTRVKGGTLLALGGPNAFGNNSAVSIESAGILDLGGNNNTIGSLSGAGQIHFDTSEILTINSGQGNTYSGTILGGGGLTLNAGTLTLSGLNSYEGPTQVGNGATLMAGAGPNAFGNGSDVTALGIINFQAFANTVGDLSVWGTASAGATVTASSYTQNPSSELVLDISNLSPLAFGHISSPGTINLGGNGTLTITNSGAFSPHSTDQFILLSGASLNGEFASLSPLPPLLTSGQIQYGSNQVLLTFGGPICGDGTWIRSPTGSWNVEDNWLPPGCPPPGVGAAPGDDDTATFSAVSGGGITVTLDAPVTLSEISFPNTTTYAITPSSTQIIILDSSGPDPLISVDGGTQTISAPITLSKTAQVSIASGSLACNGNLSGGGGLSLNSGTLTLGGNNSYFGTTTILGTLRAGSTTALSPNSPLIMSGGTLSLQGHSNTIYSLFGSGAVNFGASEMLTIKNGNSNTYSGNITGGGGLNLNSGLLILSGSGNNYTAFTNILGTATLQAEAINAFSSSSIISISGEGATLNLGGYSNVIQNLEGVGQVNFSGGEVLTIGNGGGIGFNGTISGNGGLTISSGVFILGKAGNNYTGLTTISTGAALQAAATNAFSSGSTISIASGGNLNLVGINNEIGGLSGSGQVNFASSEVLTISGIGINTFSGNILGGSGGGSLTLSSGTLTLSGTNNYHENTTISTGAILQSGSATALSPNSPFLMGGGTLSLQGHSNTIYSLSGSGQINFSGSEILTISNGNPISYSGSISGGGGGGGLTLGLGTFTLSGTNTYSGTTTISGTLRAGSSSALSPHSSFLISGGNLNLNGNSNTIGGLSGSGQINFGASEILTINNVGSSTYSGNILGSGGLTLGSGTLTLSGTNTYGGPTTISAGATLKAGSTSAFGSNSDVTVNGTLDFQTSANTVGNFTNSGHVLSKATISTVTYTQHSGASLFLDIPGASVPPFGHISSTGKITLDGALTFTNTGGAPLLPSTPLTLLSSSGSGKQRSGKFSSATLPSGGHLKYSQNSVKLEFSSTSCNNGVWNSSSSGTWGDGTAGGGPHWAATCAPGVGATPSDNASATFPEEGAGTITVTLANNAGSSPQNVTLNLLSFEALNTSYLIQQFSGGGTITLVAQGGSTADISVSEGAHTINAPLILQADTVTTLESGSLTLGAQSSMTGSHTWTLREGTHGGTLINHASLSPSTIVIDGSTLNNYAPISPSTLTIGGMLGIESPATVNNSSTITATTLSIGGAGPTTVTNQGTMASSGNFTISSGTVQNLSSGHVHAISGQTLSVSGGSIFNDASSTFGSSDASLVFTGGTLSTSGSVLASSYVQGSSALLQVNVSSPTSFGSVGASQSASLNGQLTVNAQGDFSFPDDQTIDILTAVGGLSSTQFSATTFQNFPPSVIPSLIYLPNEVQLHVKTAIPSHSKAKTHVTFTSVNQHNSFITRKCLQLRDRFPEEHKPTPPLASNALYASNTDSLLASEQTDEESPFVSLLGQETSFEQKQEQLTERVTGAYPGKPWSVYTGPIGSLGHVNKKEDQAGFHYHSVGALAGFDYALINDEENHCCDFGAGGLVDYRRIDGSSLFTTDALHASAYATLVPTSLPDLAFDGIGGYAYGWTTLHRKTGIHNALMAVGKPHESIYDFLFDVEYTFSHRAYSCFPKRLRLTPLANVQYIHVAESSYRERGAGIYNLDSRKETFSSLSSTLGTRLSYLFGKSAFTLRTELDLGWQREFLNHDKKVAFTAFNITDRPTTATAFGAGRNSLLVDLDALATFHETYQVEATGAYKWNNLFYDLSFYVGFGVLF